MAALEMKWFSLKSSTDHRCGQHKTSVASTCFLSGANESLQQKWGLRGGDVDRWFSGETRVCRNPERLASWRRPRLSCLEHHQHPRPQQAHQESEAKRSSRLSSFSCCLVEILPGTVSH
ncbi:Protein Ahnak2 [Manis pentadactyla]|nr:Protein Ahnak2 [Manis pentadactyla]